ncbi:hypothetical protein LguiA_029747 [Lonicera macranthoides]
MGNMWPCASNGTSTKWRWVVGGELIEASDGTSGGCRFSFLEEKDASTSRVEIRSSRKIESSELIWTYSACHPLVWICKTIEKEGMSQIRAHKYINEAISNPQYKAVKSHKELVQQLCLQRDWKAPPGHPQLEALMTVMGAQAVGMGVETQKVPTDVDMYKKANEILRTTGLELSQLTLEGKILTRYAHSLPNDFGDWPSELTRTVSVPSPRNICKTVWKMGRKQGFFSASKDEVVQGLSTSRSQAKSSARNASLKSDLLHRRKSSLSANPEALISRSESMRPLGETLTPLMEGPDLNGGEKRNVKDMKH